MRRTKLLDTLLTLSPRERLRWRRFFHAGFHNKHADLQRLGNYLLTYLTTDIENDTDPLHKRRVFAHVFGPEAPYQELKLNNLISDLYELLLDFLAFLRREADPLEQQYHTVMALLERNLDRHAEVELEKYRRLLDRKPDRTADHQRHLLHYWEASELLQARRARAAGEHLRRQAEALDAAHTLEQLRLAVSMLSRNTLAVLKSDDRPRRLDRLRNLRQEESAATLLQLPAIQTYLAALDLLELPAPTTFSTLKTALEAHHAIFIKEELLALYQCALNYSIRRINDGDAEAYTDALALYRALLERGLLLQQGQLSQWAYKNIATAGLRAGEFGWTEQFLHDYRERLPATERTNAFAFNIASLYFEQQDYAATLQTLQNVEFTDVTYHLGAKILQLKSFYLLEEMDALNALLTATQQLLRRNRSLSAFGKTTNLNFLKMLRKAAVWRRKSMVQSPEKWTQAGAALRAEISATQPVANKDWLLKVL